MKTQKLKLDKHQTALRAVAEKLQGVGELYRHVLAFAVAECPEQGDDAGKSAHITERFNAALTGLDAAFNTLRLYLSAAINIALRQTAVAKVAVPKADGQIGPKATREVRLTSITNKRDFEKLAAAAREARTGQTHGATGKPKVTAVTQAAAANPSQNFQDQYRAMIKLQAGRANLILWAKMEGYLLTFSMADATLAAPTPPAETPTPPAPTPTPTVKGKGKRAKASQTTAH